MRWSVGEQAELGFHQTEFGYLPATINVRKQRQSG
jgi:hypothetical protein